MLTGLKRLYRSYSDCRRDECRAQLPPAWRLTAAEERRLTRHELRATTRYFAD